MYWFKCNLLWWYDWSHGACNDLDLAFASVGKRSLMILMLIIFHLPHGPDREPGMRWCQMKSMLEWMFKNCDPRTFQLFQARAPDIISEYSAHFNDNTHETRELSLWEHMKANAAYEKKGYKCTMQQFMEWIRRGKESISLWTLVRFKSEFLALETDMLTPGEIGKALKVKLDTLTHAAMLKTTSIAATTADTHYIRSSCKNGVVVAANTLSQTFLWRRCLGVMVTSGEPVSVWQGRCVKNQVDCPSSAKWLREQMERSFLVHQVEILELLEADSALRMCGFFDFEACEEESAEAAIELDEEVARLWGNCSLQIIGCRQIRLFYCTNNWPHRMRRSACGALAAAEQVARFKRDYDNFLIVDAEVNKTQVMQTQLFRTCFRTTPVKQLVCAFKELGFAPHEDIRRLVLDDIDTPTNTKMVEDLNNIMKNSGQIRGSKLMRRPQRAMAICHAKQVLHKRLKYAAPPDTTQLDRKKLCLDANAFGKTPRQPSLDLAPICTTNPVAPYFSTPPETRELPAPILCCGMKRSSTIAYATCTGLPCLSFATCPIQWLFLGTVPLAIVRSRGRSAYDTLNQVLSCLGQ